MCSSSGLCGSRSDLRSHDDGWLRCRQVGYGIGLFIQVGNWKSCKDDAVELFVDLFEGDALSSQRLGEKDISRLPVKLTVHGDGPSLKSLVVLRLRNAFRAAS